MSNSDKPTYKTITTSGKYQLKLISPKLEKIKPNKNNYNGGSLFFVDAEGNCLNQYYSTDPKYVKGLTITIGKFSGKFAKAIDPQATADQFYNYVSQASGCIAEVDVDVKDAEPFNGKPQYKYRFLSINPIVRTGSPTAENNIKAEDLGAIDF